MIPGLAGYLILMLVIGAWAFVLAYTLLGGLMADAITDVVQGVALAIGLVVIWIGVMSDDGHHDPGAGTSRSWQGCADHCAPRRLQDRRP